MRSVADVGPGQALIAETSKLDAQVTIPWPCSARPLALLISWSA